MKNYWLASAKMLLAAGLMAVTPLCAAEIWTFGGSGGSQADGASMSFQSAPGLFNVTATAWGRTGSGGAFDTARLGQYSGGLGVCNDDEISNGCSSSGTPPEHSTDNNGADDFILFIFSSPVTLTSAFLNAFGDTDITYWTATTLLLGPSLAGVDTDVAAQMTAKGFGAATHNAGGSSNRSASLVGGPITALLIGAARPNPCEAASGGRCASIDDGFKLYSITTENLPLDPTVPEPATYALMGIALVGLGLVKRAGR